MATFRRRTRSNLRCLAIASTIALSASPSLMVSPAAAGWSDPYGLVLGPARHPSPTATVPDGTGGALVAYSAHGAYPNDSLLVQHVLADGSIAPGWPSGGAVAAAPARPNDYGVLEGVSDGAGGAFVLWVETTYPLFDQPGIAYVQHVLADGSVAPGWPARGRTLSSSTSERQLSAAPDGSGGVLVCRAVGNDIRVLRVRADGTNAPGYPAGGYVLSAPLPATTMLFPHLARDGAAGYWVTYTAMTLDSTQSPSAYCLVRLTSSGGVDPNWAGNGRVLGDFPSTMVMGSSTAVGDGSGGAYLLLVLTGAQDQYGFYSAGEARLLHVLDDGSDDPAWPAGGLWLGPGQGPGIEGPAQHCDLATDGAGGIYAAWREADYQDYSLLRRVHTDGSLDPAWPAPQRAAFIRGGLLLADAQGVFAGGWGLASVCIHQTYCFGVAAVARRSTNGSIPDGWTPPAPTVAPPGGWPLVGWSGPSSMTADGTGGVYAAWTDERGVVSVMRYLVQGPIAGVGPAVPGALVLSGARFSSAGIRVAVGGLVDHPGDLVVFDLLGRRIAGVQVPTASSNTVIQVPGTGGLHSGLYFLRLRAPNGDAHARVLVTR